MIYILYKWRFVHAARRVWLTAGMSENAEFWFLQFMAVGFWGTMFSDKPS